MPVIISARDVLQMRKASQRPRPEMAHFYFLIFASSFQLHFSSVMNWQCIKSDSNGKQRGTYHVHWQWWLEIGKVMRKGEREFGKSMSSISQTDWVSDAKEANQMWFCLLSGKDLCFLKSTCNCTENSRRIKYCFCHVWNQSFLLKCSRPAKCRENPSFCPRQ